jgi:hypothetical protein
MAATRGDCPSRNRARECFHSRADLVQSHFPAALEFRGDETILGIDPVELPFGQSGGVPRPLELTFRGMLTPAGTAQ